MKEDAMPEFDWRSPESLKPLHDITAAGFAWEFLRLNPDYHRDVKRLSLTADPANADAFAARWGLSFPRGPEPVRRRGPRRLAGGHQRLRRPPRPRTAWLL